MTSQPFQPSSDGVREGRVYDTCTESRSPSEGTGGRGAPGTHGREGGGPLRDVKEGRNSTLAKRGVPTQVRVEGREGLSRDRVLEVTDETSPRRDGLSYPSQERSSLN